MADPRAIVSSPDPPGGPVTAGAVANGLPGRRPGTVRVTVSIDGVHRDVDVEVARSADPRHELTRLRGEVGDVELVVDRSGIALRGALLGGDLRDGDRLVPLADRTRPTLVALDGPLRGASATVDRELDLGRGGRFAGRTIDDEQVSRRHLRLVPTPGALKAVDHGSRNGTLRNGTTLDGTVDLHPGDHLAIGSSSMVLVGDPPRRDHLVFGDGVVAVRRSTRPPPAEPGAGIHLPAARQAGWARGWWLAAIALVASVAAAVAAADARVVAIGVVLAGVWAVVALNRWRDRPRGAATADPHQAAVDALWSAGRAHLAWRHRLWPDPAATASTVASWSPDLWPRGDGHPAHLTVRAGRADAYLAVDPPATRGAPQGFAEAVAAAATLPDAPLVVDLRTSPVIGIAGPEGSIAEHLAAWYLHLGVAHTPDEIELGVVARGSGAIARLSDALRWFPHVAGTPGPGWCRHEPGAVGELGAHLRRRIDGPTPRRWLVVAVDLDAAVPAAVPVLDDLARRAPACTLIWLGPAPRGVPEGCSPTIVVGGDHPAVLRPGTADTCRSGSRPDRPLGGEVGFEPDRVDLHHFEELARLLAPLRDGGPTQGDPPGTGAPC